MKKILALSFFILTFRAFSCSGILPLNHLKIPAHKTDGLGQNQYHNVIDLVFKVYGPVVRNYGAQLVINREWSSPTVNAGTYRNGNRWIVNLYGGLARHRYMTKDAFALVICHELGHHIGGAPKKTLRSGRPFWSSTEGQSDYWGTLKCLRKLFENDDNASIVSGMQIPSKVMSDCESLERDQREIDLCRRISMAGLALSSVTADSTGANLPNFETPDLEIVRVTYEMHPKSQCRLDTYYAGILCQRSWWENVSEDNEVPGTCHQSLKDVNGLRPLCWHYPKNEMMTRPSIDKTSGIIISRLEN